MRQKLVSAVLISLLAAQSVTAAVPTDLNLPQMGEPADLSMTPTEEREIGRDVVAQLYSAGYILDDAELTDYMSGIGWTLATYADNKPESFQFFVVKDPSINAFALPGGYIGFNAGLLIASRNESEVAGVMGHEMAHVTQRHIARTIEGTKVSNMATMAAMLAGIIAGAASGNGDLIIGSLGAGSALSYQNQVNFTRAHEMEADRVGIRTMAEAGFDPESMASFFQRLEQQSRLYGSGVPEILRTHPVNTTRIAEAESRARDYPVRSYHQSTEFPLMQARATVLSASRASQARELYLRKMDAGDETVATRYGAALALSELSENERAMQVLEPALEKMPRNTHLRLLEAHLQLETKQGDRALATLEDVMEHQPRSAPAIFAYAEALITLDRPNEARQFLLDRGPLLEGRPDMHRLLADAAEATNNTSELAFQNASYRFERGDARGAIQQIDAGLRIAGLEDNERARLAAFRSEVRSALPKNWRPSDNRR